MPTHCAASQQLFGVGSQLPLVESRKMRPPARHLHPGGSCLAIPCPGLRSAAPGCTCYRSRPPRCAASGARFGCPSSGSGAFWLALPPTGAIGVKGCPRQSCLPPAGSLDPAPSGARRLCVAFASKAKSWGPALLQFGKGISMAPGTWRNRIGDEPSTEFHWIGSMIAQLSASSS